MMLYVYCLMSLNVLRVSHYLQDEKDKLDKVCKLVISESKLSCQKYRKWSDSNDSSKQQ